MTAWVEGKRSFFLSSQAMLIPDDREIASGWASKHMVHNPALKYVIGRFVEADRANSNKQLFSLDGLQMAKPTITYAPMNMNHSQRRVVGAYVAAEMIYPIDAAARQIADDSQAPQKCTSCGAMQEGDDDTCPECGETFPEREPGVDTTLQPGYVAALAQIDDAGLNPYIEALGVFWRHYFPEEYSLVEAAHAEGRLFYSMECVPGQIQCAGGSGCGETFEYAGRQSPMYCEHLNSNSSDKFLIDPHFTAGAILVPPVNPGWSRADVHSLVANYAEAADALYEGLKEESPHLAPAEWEAAMVELLVLASRS